MPSTEENNSDGGSLCCRSKCTQCLEFKLKVWSTWKAWLSGTHIGFRKIIAVHSTGRPKSYTRPVETSRRLCRALGVRTGRRKIRLPEVSDLEASPRHLDAPRQVGLNGGDRCGRLRTVNRCGRRWGHIAGLCTCATCRCSMGLFFPDLSGASRTGALQFQFHFRCASDAEV